MACSCCRGATPRRTVCTTAPLNPTLYGSELEDGARASQVGTDTNPPMCAEKMTEPWPRSQSQPNVCRPVYCSSISA